MGLSLEQAFATALQGDEIPLRDLLARHSGLPGTRPNEAMLEHFAQLCRAEGRRVDTLLERFIRLDADIAPGGGPFEFVPMCGVRALGFRVAADARLVKRGLSILHDAAEDFRFRVRAEVPMALERILGAHGTAASAELDPWMEGYFQAGAVVLALGTKGALAKVPKERAIELVSGAFALVEAAPRATARYPGFKALLTSFSALPAIMLRVGEPFLDAIHPWVNTKRPDLREALVSFSRARALTTRFSEAMAGVQKALSVSAPVPRDPRALPRPTRRRGGQKGGRGGKRGD